MAAPADLAERQRRMYDSLARYQWLRRRAALAGRGSGLELHKRLKEPKRAGLGPGAGTTGLHDWVWSKLGLGREPRVLDVGCGFGATLIAWARRHAGRFTGIGTSAYQIRRARQQARACGVGDRCTFHVHSYTDPIEGEFDGIISVEALVHAPSLGHTLHNLASCLAPGGALLAVEDVAVDPDASGDADACALIEAWSTAKLYARRDWLDAAAEAGLDLVSIDALTAQVPAREPEVLARSERSLRRLQRVCPVPAVRRVADAFLGGISLERLYAKGAVEYLAMSMRHASDGSDRAR